MQSNIIIEAEYADILMALLNNPYNINSIIKLVFIAFCVKHEKNLKVYSKRRKDFVDTFISNIDIKLISHSNELSIIFEVIDKLQANGFINIHKDQIYVLKLLPVKVQNKFLKFCESKRQNPILEVNKLDSKAFMEEVLRYV